MSLNLPKEMIMDPPQGGWQVISPTIERRSPGMTRPFRFGVVAPVAADLPAWRDRVRRIADAGYSTLLMPDVPQWQPAPGPMLALAAALADVRVGTWVYASPLRPPWITAWEAHSLSVLTEGRFEMGVGTGRPGIEDQLRELGLPVVPPSERLAQVRETVRALRDLDGPTLHTPVVMAVRGPKAQALAADVADTVTFALLPGESRVEVAWLARDFRAVRDVELALHVPVIGDTVAPAQGKGENVDLVKAERPDERDGVLRHRFDGVGDRAGGGADAPVVECDHAMRCGAAVDDPGGQLSSTAARWVRKITGTPVLGLSSR